MLGTYNEVTKDANLLHIANARKDILTMNKKKITFLSVALLSMMVLGACNAPTPDSSSSGDTSSSETSKETSVQSSETSQVSSSASVTPSSSSIVKTKYTVTFVVNGQTVQTSQVEEGEKAEYTGQEPTKASDAADQRYTFAGWDKDIDAPITGPTTFTAQFLSHTYANQQMIDDFESYELTAEMLDEDWVAIGWVNGGWSEETKASVSLGAKSVEGKKALRFDAWENDVGYKFAKKFKDGEFKKSANALKFRAMLPSINTFKVLLYAKATIAGKEQVANFNYTINLKSSEYVEYVIPLADPGWAMWGEAGKSIKTVADYIGIHEDDIVQHLTKIEFYAQGNDGIGGQPYVAFLDSASFVTIDNPTYSENETMGQYTKYTGLLTDGHTVKIELGADGAATATVVDMQTPMQIPGTVAIDANKNMTFTSSDSGATLVYKGQLINGGQSIKYVSASGQLAAMVNDVRLEAVQIVDNFEQYTSDGTSYHAGENPTTKEQRSGCRGAYYSEFYKGSGSSPWGGNGWSLMEGDGSQLKLKQDTAGAHSGNNYLCLKHARDKAMRYMQWGLFDGTAEQQTFRGSKFSFWAKTNGWVKSVKVYMYSQSSPTNATRDNYVKSYEFVETEAFNEWKHYEIDLNPKLVYYGYAVLINNNYPIPEGTDTTAYYYIDDVEVYTASPYAQYHA